MDSVLLADPLALLALTFGGATGFLSGRAWVAALRSRRAKVQALSVGTELHGKDRADFVLALMERGTLLFRSGQERPWCPSALRSAKRFKTQAVRAGVAGAVSEAAFAETRFRLCLLGGVLGLGLGGLLSGALALLLGFIGAFGGWKLPGRVLRHREQEREASLEEHLPEMLDVMALGVRSGLSFDAALKLYCTHFGTQLSHELKVAQDLWMAGLQQRSDALQELASTYDSGVFMRVVDAWVRSLRFGTSLVEGLEAESVQVRNACKAQREERIAKAPVKMMVPTGVLILPAMLILVLGPVLLELMNGGF